MEGLKEGEYNVSSSGGSRPQEIKISGDTTLDIQIPVGDACPAFADCRRSDGHERLPDHRIIHTGAFEDGRMSRRKQSTIEGGYGELARGAA